MGGGGDAAMVEETVSEDAEPEEAGRECQSTGCRRRAELGMGKCRECARSNREHSRGVYAKGDEVRRMRAEAGAGGEPIDLSAMVDGELVHMQDAQYYRRARHLFYRQYLQQQRDRPRRGDPLPQQHIFSRSPLTTATKQYIEARKSGVAEEEARAQAFVRYKSAIGGFILPSAFDGLLNYEIEALAARRVRTRESENS